MLNRRPSVLAACAILLLGFASTAWFAIQTKSATYDEPYHAVSAWVQWNRHDFRIDNEDPPLWQYWASLLNGPNALRADFEGSDWRSMPLRVVSQWYWSVVTLYRTAGNDPIAFVNRCRGMMLPLAVGLGTLIAYWSWKLGGAVAAIVSTALFALDPNFLAHSALMKNDVVFALSLLLLAFTLWRAGRNLSIANILSVALLSVVTLSVKFSGLVAVMLVPAMLGLRSVLPEPWIVAGRTISSRIGRAGAASAVVALCAIICYAGIWAVYGFRFRPTPAPDVWLNMQELADRGRSNHLLAMHDGDLAAYNRDHIRPVPTVETVMFFNRHGLLPQAYLAGCLFTYDSAQIRPSYVLGRFSYTGWWWYFPFAMLVKTPLATLLAGLISAVIIGRNIRTVDRWTALCLAVPFAVFLCSAMLSHLNIGIRHVLGLYPFAFIAMGWAASRVWAKPKARIGIAAILIGLAGESLSAYPSFIPFFNVGATTIADKIDLLGDSNLDWGQDLPLLRQWQLDHPTQKLYLCYFGYVDPAYYKIQYVPLPGGYYYDPKPEFPDPLSRSVVAISASNLQLIFIGDSGLRKFYGAFRRQKPIAILGDSIYLYEYDATTALIMERQTGRLNLGPSPSRDGQ